MIDDGMDQMSVFSPDDLGVFVATGEGKQARRDKREEDGNGAENDIALRSASMMKTVGPHKVMRMLSTSALDDVLDWHFEAGVAYHVATGGQVDNMTMLEHVLRQQHAKYVLIATWVMWKEDAERLLSMLDRGIVDRFDFYVGEIFKGGYRGTRPVLDEICGRCGGRVARFRNHSKVTLVYGDRFDVCIEGSANVNTNPRHEQMCATVDTGLCDFYREYYDGINDFDGGYKDWVPWRG